MPYDSIEAAKTAEFPTTAEGINLTLAQINKLASIYDAIKAAGTAENAMAVAWTSWKKLYKKEEDKWVLREKESVTSAVLTSALIGKSDWIPVAADGQETTLSLESGDVVLHYAPGALGLNLESWKGGYINVNHADNAAIKGYLIEDAKFENGLLYHKVNPNVADFIRNSASSGRSIEAKLLKIVDDTVVDCSGLGLSVLYPPYIPACGPDMGCSSHSSIGGNTMDENSQSMLKRFENLLHSFKNPLSEEAGTDPNLETNEMEEIEKLTSARIAAETSRDEALKEVETLTSSLVEKDTALSDKDKTISEQTERLKSYETAEAEAATKLKDDQWETLKSSIPAGKLHKEEDAKALKEEFLTDPSGFAVKMASWKREDPQGESGSEYVLGDPDSQEAKDMAVAERLGA